MTSPSDADLVRRCLEDDAGAWTTLTERYADLVFGIARRSGLDATGAADVVQEVFLALLTHLKRLRKTDRLIGWVVQSARRESWRQVRRGRGRQKLEKKVAKPEESPRPPPAEALADLELQQAVKQAFAGIGERCRRLLDALFGLDAGVPYAQIAADLGLAVGSIGALRARCLAELRQELERLGHPPAE